MTENKIKWENLFPDKIEFEVLVSVAPENMEWRMWHVATEEQKKKYIDYQLVRNGIDIQILNTPVEVIDEYSLPKEFVRKPIYHIGNFYVTDIEDARKILSVVENMKLYWFESINGIFFYEKRDRFDNKSISYDSVYIDNDDGLIKKAITELKEKVEHNKKQIAIRQSVLEEAEPFLNKYKEMDKNLIAKYNRMENMYNLYNNYVDLTFYDDMIFNLLNTIHHYSKEDIDDLKELLDLAKRNGTGK